MSRIEVYEKYRVNSGASEYDELWWAENMPRGAKRPDSGQASYAYRRTMVLIDEIERPIEIPGNEKEMMLRFWTGEDMTIAANYDEFCIMLEDIEEELDIEDAIRQSEIQKHIE